MKPASPSKHLLVIRFSSMGDVVLTVPVLKYVLEKNPEVKITFVTRKSFVPLFHGIDRLSVKPADVKGAHKGITGVNRLFSELQQESHYDSILDLHSVLRSRILTGFFELKGEKVYRIRKGRAEKTKITKGAELRKLKHTTGRYLDVFRMVLPGLTGPLNHLLAPVPSAIPGVDNFIKTYNISEKSTWIGLAPMAKHPLKMWDLDNFREIIDKISASVSAYFLLFGGGSEEKSRLDALAVDYGNVVNVTGQLKLEEEVQLVSRLHFMISMDSANMHIASLVGIPTFSIWGGTHPFLGFSALNQPEENCIQIPQEDLGCRPCTVYGKGSCHRGDLACLKWITPDMVINRILKPGLLK